MSYEQPINDILDIVEELTNIVEEINPGATEQVRRIRFLIGRAERLTNPRDSVPGQGGLKP